MKFTLYLQVTGESPVQIACDTEQSFPQTFRALGMAFTLERSQRYSLTEYTLSFVPGEEIRMHSMALELPFAGNNIGSDFPLTMFDNEMCTNAFARIIPLRPDIYTIRSREIVTIHSEKGDLNAAFTTFNRFYTEFTTNGKGIRAEWYLEDKPVHPGQEYVLETIALDDTLGGLEFFERYTQTLHDRYQIKPMKPIPAGWSSWSCLYGDVDEQAVLKHAELLAEGWLDRGADLIQIDDGWQKEGSFGAYWTNDVQKFGHDIPWLAENCRKLGLQFGLWMAPGMLIDKSSRFEELSPLINRVNGKLVRHFGGDDTLAAEKNGAVYGLDIGKEEVIELMREMFRRGAEDYHAVYFKIDFIVNLLLRMGAGATRVEYQNGYAVELYRHYMKELRKVVGDDVFLLACGAPIGESVGIFDSIRISADIAHGGADKPGHFGAWNIIRNDAQCAILRSPFHNKVFINDPDALLVRDYQTEYCNDGVVLTLEEAKMWATVVAMSGGHIIINEELDRLPDERKALFTNILPPLGLAARPRNFYEYPWCSEAFIDAAEDAQLVAFYNWGEEELDKTLANPFDRRAIMVDCWSHEIIGFLDEAQSFTLPAHTCRAMLVKRLPEQFGFLFNDGDFYLGLGEKNGCSYYYNPEADLKHCILKDYRP